METCGRCQSHHRKYNETWLIFDQAIHPCKILFMNYTSYSLNITNIKALNAVFLNMKNLENMKDKKQKIVM